MKEESQEKKYYKKKKVEEEEEKDVNLKNQEDAQKEKDLGAEIPGNASYTEVIVEEPAPASSEVPCGR